MTARFNVYRLNPCMYIGHPTWAQPDMYVDIYLVAGLNSAVVKNQDSTTWKASLFGA
jgi:hypothetical protein